ncbi:hypothetical protein NL108_005268 [Boleophthalmus pectinirostris]|nr:hypothetical protein NL108_005268 [Boleophthalmus pectinirostris]
MPYCETFQTKQQHLTNPPQHKYSRWFNIDLICFQKDHTFSKLYKHVSLVMVESPTIPMGVIDRWISQSGTRTVHPSQNKYRRLCWEKKKRKEKKIRDGFQLNQ